MDYCQIHIILYLVSVRVVDVLHAAVDTNNRSIRCGLSEYLEDLDYVDAICLLSSKASDMQYKLNDHVKELV